MRSQMAKHARAQNKYERCKCLTHLEGDRNKFNGHQKGSFKKDEKN